MPDRYFYPQSDIDSAAWATFGAGSTFWGRLNDVALSLAVGGSAQTPDHSNGIASDVIGATGIIRVGLVGDLRAGDVVSSLVVRVWARNLNLGDAMPLRIYLTSNGTDSAPVAFTVPTDDGNFHLYTATFTVDPDTGTVWTAPGANAAAIGCDKGASLLAGLQISAAEVRAGYTVPAPTGDFTAANLGGNLIEVNAGGVIPAAGYTITDYSWSWGDGSPAGNGMNTRHTYAAGGTYTVTLTVTYDSGDTFQLTREVNMVVITRVSPRLATRGAAGILITITGTGFGATQGSGDGGVTIGGVDAIIASWSATSITCRADDSPATPLGMQDLIVTADGGDAATQVNAVYVYDATDNKDTGEQKLGMVQQLFIDGEQLGITGESGMTETEGVTAVQATPDDRFVPSFDEEFVTSYEVSCSLMQASRNGALLAKCLGGSYDVTADVLTIPANASRPTISFLAIDSVGRILFIPQAKITGNVARATVKKVKELPLTVRAIAPANPADPFVLEYLNSGA